MTARTRTFIALISATVVMVFLAVLGLNTLVAQDAAEARFCAAVADGRFDDLDPTEDPEGTLDALRHLRTVAPTSLVRSIDVMITAVDALKDVDQDDPVAEQAALEAAGIDVDKLAEASLTLRKKRTTACTG